MFTNTKYTPLICLLPLLVISSHASAFEWSDLGLRIGIDAENSVDVKSYELITHLDSPWNWTVADDWEIDLNFEFGLGALDGEGKTGLLAHAGPSIELGFRDMPLELVVSTGPALLSEHEFDDLDLGGSIHLMSAVGLDLKLNQVWTFGYRYLHISNAGLHDKNPGMNLHALNLRYKF